MDLSCPLFTMRPRRSVPFLLPTIALYSKQLLLYNSRPLGTHLKSTLLQVFILRNLKPFGINTYEKHGRGYRLWLTKCSKVVSSSILRTHFQVPYPATPLFATLTKTAGVCRISSHFGTEHPRRKCESWGGGASSAFFTRHSSLVTALFTPETLSRQYPAPTSVRSCSTPFSALRPAPESRKSARRHAGGGNTQNTRRASPARGNTICIRSLHRCLSPSARGPDTSPGNRAPNRAVARVPPAPRRYPHTRWDSHRKVFPAAPGHSREIPSALR